ncbi:angiopoietin-2-like [Ostrea edulis]|uniref:angiopoietin-2-like n=1 Tax=Ostrea edulis TaxID=37623 RepID=UPI0024AF976A|nr:angiopoietin-2-like [Ostrea edulis]
MKSTTLCIRCFLHVMLCTLSKADIISQHYILDPSLDNKVSNNSLMTKHHSESLIECSAKCGELCVCFGFNPQLKKCRIHQSCDPANMTVDETGWRYFRPNDWDRDCEKLQENGHTRSGVYKIKPFGKSSQAISVYCDMETSGGGWTAIQRRITGSVDFYRTWNEYKVGFGTPEAYWIGNDVIHQLTKGRNTSLYVAITLQNDTTLYELYEQFSVSDEADKYRLLVNGSATGTLDKEEEAD